MVGMTAIFTGGALALQIYDGSVRGFRLKAWCRRLWAIGMVRELGPVLVGLMVAARVTSSIAAEIATMKVTEQIDALVTLSTHPMKYLVAPRVMAAAILVVPMHWLALAISLASMADFLVATENVRVQSQRPTSATPPTSCRSMTWSPALVKGLRAFGGIAAVMGCYAGMHSGRGAQGVSDEPPRAPFRPLR